MKTYLISYLRPQTNDGPNPFKLDTPSQNLGGGASLSGQNLEACIQSLPSELFAWVVSFPHLTSALRLQSCFRVLGDQIPLNQPFWHNQAFAGCLVGNL